MLLEVVERCPHGTGALRDLCCKRVGETIVNTLWRKHLQFATIHIPANVEMHLREWIAALPAPVRQDILDSSARLLLSTIGTHVGMR